MTSTNKNGGVFWISPKLLKRKGATPLHLLHFYRRIRGHVHIWQGTRNAIGLQNLESRPQEGLPSSVGREL